MKLADIKLVAIALWSVTFIWMVIRDVREHGRQKGKKNDLAVSYVLIGVLGYLAFTCI
jgi:hypothetical protein